MKPPFRPAVARPDDTFYFDSEFTSRTPKGQRSLRDRHKDPQNKMTQLVKLWSSRSLLTLSHYNSFFPYYSQTPLACPQVLELTSSSEASASLHHH